LERQLTREALHSVGAGDTALSIVAGPIEAIVRTTGSATSQTSEGERARLAKELGDAESQLESTRLRLADEAFTTKAPPPIVEGARRREAELAEKVDRLADRLGLDRGE
ncbi:MAG TPA: hypothetical protein VE817_10225, partial [Candidatus Acidoferrum sp.]|nr:hypothetical protein [Candidatus Acidoferrum sp.]